MHNRGTRRWWTVVADAAAGLPYVLLVYGPLAALCCAVAGSGDGAIFSALSARQAWLLGRTVLFSAGTALGITALAVLAASRLWAWRGGPGERLRWLLLAGIAIPPVCHDLAWRGLRELSRPVVPGGLPDVTGYGGAVWLAVLTWLPLATALVLAGLLALDRRMLDCALVHGGGWRGFSVVILGLLRPHLAAVAGLVFLLLCAGFTIPSLLSLTSYITEIHAVFCGGGSLAATLGLALPLLAVTALLLLPLPAGLRTAVAGGMRVQPTTGVAWDCGWWFTALQAAAVGLLVVQLGGAIVGLAALSGGWERIVAALGAARDELMLSGTVALAAGVVAVVAGLPVAAGLARWSRRAWPWVVALLPLAIPAPLVGIGLITAWNHPALESVYGGVAMPVLAVLARFGLVALIILHAWYRRIDRRLLDAARIYRRDGIHGWLAVRLPLLLPGMLAAGAAVAVLSLGELSATLLVAPPGRATLAMRIYNYLHYGASDRIAGLGLVLVLATVILAAGAGWLLTARRPAGRRNDA